MSATNTTNGMAKRSSGTTNARSGTPQANQTTISLSLWARVSVTNAATKMVSAMTSGKRLSVWNDIAAKTVSTAMLPLAARLSTRTS